MGINSVPSWQTQLDPVPGLTSAANSTRSLFCAQLHIPRSPDENMCHLNHILLFSIDYCQHEKNVRSVVYLRQKGTVKPL